MIYHNRNILKNVKVKLDLTKKRYNILKTTRSIADEKQDANYVFANINCRLKVVFKEGTSEFFKYLSELNELIEQHMPYVFGNVLGLNRKVSCFLGFSFIIRLLLLLNIIYDLWHFFFLYKNRFTFRSFIKVKVCLRFDGFTNVKV